MQDVHYAHAIRVYFLALCRSKPDLPTTSKRMAVETNIFGYIITFSLLIFCGKCVDINPCPMRAVQKEIYRSLYDVIKDNTICSYEKSTTNVELLNLGTLLSYDDFNPGKPARFAPPGVLPSKVIENGLPLVDKIYPTGTYKFRLLSNTSAITKGYQFDLFSSTYDYILTHMMLLSTNFSSQEVLRAKYYLQELIPNPERVLRNETELPRFLLYDYYRSYYLSQKGVKDDAIATNRSHLLTQLQFELWGQKKLATLVSDTEAAYYKWQTFGYKAEVEKQLQYFDVDTHEDKLMSTRALFKSMARQSERDAHATIYPFTLKPADWFKHLKVK